MAQEPDEPIPEQRTATSPIDPTVHAIRADDDARIQIRPNDGASNIDDRILGYLAGWLQLPPGDAPSRGRAARPFVIFSEANPAPSTDSRISTFVSTVYGRGVPRENIGLLCMPSTSSDSDALDRGICPNVYDALFGTGPVPSNHPIFKCRMLIVPKCVYDDAALFAHLQHLCATRCVVEGTPVGERDPWGGLAIMVVGDFLGASFLITTDLNKGQRDALTPVLSWLSRCKTAEARGVPSPPPPITSLWDGGPGTGKSYVAKALCTAANFLCGHDGAVVCCAPSGVAAALIPGARTIHNLGNIKPAEGARAAPLKPMNPATKAAYAVRLARGTCYILLVDEISMVEACLYGHLEARCAEVRQVGEEPREEWGGLAVVNVGDFGQLPPVGKSLYKQALKVFHGLRSFDVAEKAGRLFQAIRRFPLIEQVSLSMSNTPRSLLGDTRPPTPTNFPVG